MKTKRKNRKRIGISLVLLAAAIVPIAAAKKKAAPGPTAVISGSVFQESGYALPDAGATVFAEPPAGSSAGKTEEMEAVTDARGEFIFHVAAGPRRYTVAVGAKGYQTLSKTVSVEGEERVEVTFQLERESK
jgi:hypothetical protein